MTKIKFAVIGQGHIGKRHAEMIRRHPEAELVAVCDVADKAALGLTDLKEKFYSSVEELLAAHPDVEVVNICTPNGLHATHSLLALQAGKHVIVEKPISFNLDEAKSLQKLVDKSGLVLGHTHTYTGYPLVKEAKAMVAAGKFGKIRKVYVEYPQGWLSTLLEGTGNMQASWRTDPKQSGMGGAIGDIGTHAANLAGIRPRNALPMKNPLARSASVSSASRARPSARSSPRRIPGRRPSSVGGVSSMPSRSTKTLV